MTTPPIGTPPSHPEPPPQLHVALEWAAATGALDELRAAMGAELVVHCKASTTTYQAALVASGGPALDTTVTEALLIELAAWLRGLDPTAYASLTRAATSGTLLALQAGE